MENESARSPQWIKQIKKIHNKANVALDIYQKEHQER
jgi:hypothetical protein